MKIVIRAVKPPIPTREWDYMACVEGDEEEGPQGWGCDVPDALRELAEALEEEQ